MKQNASRRKFLRNVASVTGAGVLTACGITPQSPSSTGESLTPTRGVDTSPAAVASSAPAAAMSVPAEYVIDAPDKVNGWRTKLAAPPIKYDPPIEISQNFDLWPSTTFKEGESAEHNIAMRWHEQTMGIKFTPKWVSEGNDASDAKWATAMAAGDLPDFMMRLYLQRIPTLLEAGALEDITDAFERLASPTTKEFKGYPDHPFWNYVRKDGRIYGVPFTSGGLFGNDYLVWIRQDWLDKIGAKSPETLDDLPKLMKAFKEQGLGSFGISVAQGMVPSQGAWMGAVDFVYGAYGVMPGQWRKGVDGKLTYDGINPKVKEPLAVLQQWYADGLIAPDFISTAADKTGDAVVDGKCGVITGAGWMAEWPLADTAKRDAAAAWTVHRTPAGPAGHGRAGTRVFEGMTALRKGVEPNKVEAMIQQLNWRLEREANALENNDYFCFIGWTHVWEGDTIKPGPSPGVSSYEPGMGGAAGWWHLKQEELSRQAREKTLAKEKNQWNAMEQYLYSNPIQLDVAKAYDLALDTKKDQLFSAYQGLPGPVELEVSGALNTIEIESYTKIITGRAPLETFDDFAKEWSANGGDRWTEEINALYAAQQ